MSKYNWKRNKTPTKGRQKDTPNLIRKDGKLINKHNVSFTEEERKLLVSKVNQATRKRRKMLEAAANIEVHKNGKKMGYTLAQKIAMDFDSDFILAKKSKSLHRFTNKKSFYKYLENLDRVNSPNYIRDRMTIYKTNWLTGFRNNIFPHGKDVYERVKAMSVDEFMMIVQGNEEFEINYFYHPEDVLRKVAAMRAILNMRPVDDESPIDSEIIE